jgi:uncharacterized repeat protein (TIGR03803 family)
MVESALGDRDSSNVRSSMCADNPTNERGHIRLNAVCVAVVMVWLLATPVVGRAQGLYEVVATFERAGLYPAAGLIQGNDGSLYGTTYRGGAGDAGSIFKLDTAGTLTTLHSFNRFSDSLGAYPAAGLIRGLDGSFYGTTSRGFGSGDNGTIFRLGTSGIVTTLHFFTLSDGAFPYGALIQGSDGSFYGTTASGGTGFCGLPALACGTVFKLDTSGTLTTLHSFNNSDGAGPYAALIQGSDGSLYGTTVGGGPFASGTVFKLNNSGTLTTLHAFNGSDGATPVGGLIQAGNGRFYGTTAYGGVSDSGTIFEMDSSGNVTTLHAFNGDDGALPLAGLTQGSDGSVYGTTTDGGAFAWGTIFKLDTARTLTTLHSFDGSDGAGPLAGLLQSTSGSFYGTTSGGGAASVTGRTLGRQKKRSSPERRPRHIGTSPASRSLTDLECRSSWLGETRNDSR